MYLDWHHMGIRMGSGAYYFRKYFSGIMDKNGVWSTQESINEAWKQILVSLKYIEKIWLYKDRKTKFMFSDKPTIADLSLACELTALIGFGYPI